MVILMAEYAGFCFGVERAIDIAEKTAETAPSVVTLGPIIHNPQVVQDLEAKGVHVVRDVDSISGEKTVVIRSHGVTRQIYQQLENQSVPVVDATCPFVTKAQNAARNLSEDGLSVVVLGEQDHPEVVGIVSFVDGECTIVTGAEEAMQLPFRKQYGLVAQTTQSADTFRAMEDALRGKCENLTVVKTICNATTMRQSAATEIASRSDVVIVVGGKNSANTTRLYSICKEICPRTYHIETVSELTPEMFAGAETVGITAGASTPRYLMNEVREYIHEVSQP